MEDSTSREKLLKNVRDALIETTEVPFPLVDKESPLYKPMTEPLDVSFAEALIKVAGKFVYCENVDDFATTLQSFILEKDWPLLYCYDPALQHMLHQAGIPFESSIDKITEAKVGITRCESLIARLGTVVVSSKVSPGRKMTVFPEIHVVMAYTSQLVPEIKDAIKMIRSRYEGDYPSMISFITGPSRTADIEKTLVMGAHGPKELYVFLIEDNSAQ